MWKLKIFFVFALGFFMNGVAGRLLKGQLRIIGGHEVNITEYPHQVAVILKGEHKCGGSIINEKYVLTAAHCIKRHLKADDYKIRAGSSFWKKDGVLYDVESVTPHPKFTYDGLDYDVGIIRISGTFEINGVTTNIVKLADASSKLAAGDLVTVTGWGSTENFSPSSDMLKAAFLPVFDHERCINVYKRLNAYVTDNMLCAGNLLPFQSACEGDSGGPLVDKDMVQHGVVSFGHKDCDKKDFPTVFSSVASLRSWIKENSGV